MSTPERKQNVLIRKLQFNTEYSLFIILNLLIVFLKLVASKQPGADPTAATWWYLGRAGYIAVSIALMLGVIGLVEVVARRRRRAARIALWFGILVLAALAAMGGYAYYDSLQRAAGPF